MAAATSIVINDGAATPVAITFAPERVTPDLSVFTDRSAGIGLAFRRLRTTFSASNAKRPTNRASFEVAMPVTSVVGGVTSVAFTMRAKVEVIIPDGATAANRNDLYAFLSNGLSHALVRGNLRDLDPLW